MKRAIVFAIALVIVLPGIVSAYVSQGLDPPGCPYDGSNSITITRFCAWEAYSQFGDVTLYATSNDANLNGYTVTNNRICGGALRINHDWNDCIDSVRVWINANDRICWYRDAFGGGDKTWQDGPRIGFNLAIPAFLHDAVSSFYIIGKGQLC